MHFVLACENILSYNYKSGSVLFVLSENNLLSPFINVLLFFFAKGKTFIRSAFIRSQVLLGFIISGMQNQNTQNE